MGGPTDKDPTHLNLDTMSSSAITYASHLIVGDLTLVGPNGPYAPNLPGNAAVATPAGVQTGALWDYGGEVFNFEAFGAKGDGVTDSTVAIQAAYTKAGTAAAIAGGVLPTIPGHNGGTIPCAATVAGPPGVFIITATIVKTQGVNTRLEPGCIIRAGAVVAGPMLQWPVATFDQDGFCVGGIWDANDQFARVWDVRAFYHITLSDSLLMRPTSHYVTLSDPAAATASIEGMLRNLHLWRPSSSTKPAGSFGIWVRATSTDNKIMQCVVVGADSSFRIDSDMNQIHLVHAWGFPGQIPTQCFDDNGFGNTWIGCKADTASAYGWLLRQNHALIIGGQVWNGSSSGGSDNIAVGIHSNAGAGTGSYVVMGVRFAGSDVTHRLKTDIEGDMTLAHVFGCIQVFVVTANSFDQNAFMQSGSFKSTGDFRRGYQNVAYTAAPTPDPTKGEIFYMFLTGNVAPGAPPSPINGQTLIFDWEQDGTGTRTITYNAIFKTGGAAAIVTTGATHTIDEFVYQGAAWRLKSRQTGQA